MHQNDDTLFVTHCGQIDIGKANIVGLEKVH